MIFLSSCVAEPDGLRILDLHRPAGPADRAAVEAAGLTVVAAHGPTSWIVAGRGRASIAGATSSPLDPESRLGPGVRALQGDEGPVALVVGLAPRGDVVALTADASRAGLVVVGASAERVVLTGDAAAVVAARASLAARPDVAWIIRRYPRRLVNARSASVGQVGLAGGGATPLYDAGLLGQGQIAAILDSGIDADHCAFDDPVRGLPLAVGPGDVSVDPSHRKLRVVDFLWDEEDPADPLAWDTFDHGTHVAGTLAGDAGAVGAWDRGDGMAPAATLVIQDGGYVPDPLCTDMIALGCPVTELDAVLDQAYAQGARVHSNSWGDVQGVDDVAIYTDACMDLDAFVWDHPTFFVAFAAGNSGPDDNTVGNPSTAKNVLSVAATQPGEDAGGLADFSSRGPTNDGRVKPDVAFPGANIVSANGDGDVSTPSCDERRMSGTSMATPGAAGMAVLVRQYFVDGYYPGGAPDAARGFDPSAALVKAVLIHSATPMEAEKAPIPSTGQGWGRIQLADALPLPGGARALYVDDTRAVDAIDEEVAYDVDVAADTDRLKVTLVWSDWPSTPLAATHLVHDLDLVVTAPDGTIFLGNALEAGVSAPAAKVADRRNNVEQVIVAAPLIGRWRVTARAYALPMAAQPFALVVSGAITSVEPVVEEPVDTGAPAETGVLEETGAPVDTGLPADSAPVEDSDGPSDSVAPLETGPTDPPSVDETGASGKACACAAGGAKPGWIVALAGLVAWRRRSRGDDGRSNDQAGLASGAAWRRPATGERAR